MSLVKVAPFFGGQCPPYDFYRRFAEEGGGWPWMIRERMIEQGSLPWHFVVCFAMA